MKINIVYFSQTGNTRKVAKSMAEVFQSKGHDVRTLSFKKAVSDVFINCDLIGVGAPCFESQAPSPVRELLWDLPDLTGKKAFVFSTSGGGPGKVLYDLAKPLMKKGADVIGGFLCRGTCFYPVPCLVGRFPERPDEEDLAHAKVFAGSVIDHVSSGISGPMPGSRPDALKHGLGFYHIIGDLMNDSLIRLMMPKPKVDSAKCTACGWCVAECPTNSIILDPQPVFAKTCFRCYRCLTGCPEDALMVKWGIANFMVWTLYNQTFERWLGDIQKGEKIY
ncbi:MAG: EFR1 family ferrodoxin [Proteobacteria bacterium]|nr:EFR1 family ferrodoxin [Pseudomonadota bacterium]